MRLTRHLPVFLVLLLAACSGGDRQGTADHWFRTETGEGGVPVAVSSTVPRYVQPPVRLVEEARLRSDESNPESLLFRTMNFNKGPDGSMVFWTILTIRTLDGDSLGVVESGKRIMAPPIAVEGMGRVSFSAPYSVNPSVQYVRGRGILALDGHSPEFVWYDLRGQPTKKIQLDLQPAPVTDELKENYFAELRLAMEKADNDATRNFSRARLEHSEFPDLMPYYQRVVVDDAGYLWVLPVYEHAGEMIPEAQQKIRLLSPEGEYLGDVDIPMNIYGISKGTVCAGLYDMEAGDVTLVAYRIESAVPGFVYP